MPLVLVDPVWFQGIETAGLKLRHVDAKEQVVGRLAAHLSVILQVLQLHSQSPCKGCSCTVCARLRTLENRSVWSPSCVCALY